MAKLLGKVEGLLAVVLVVFLVFVSSISSLSVEQASNNMKDEEVSGLSGRHKFVVMPSSLTRFLFYNTKPYERFGASGNNILDNKRSGSALDMITGVTLGKRSVPVGPAGSGFGRPVDFVNMEPLFSSQQYGLNMMPRLYDIPRWSPLEMAYEPANSSPSQANSE